MKLTLCILSIGHHCFIFQSPTPTAQAGPTFTFTPTHHTIETSVPISGDVSCTDTPGWVDAFGDSCAWYAMNDSPGCPVFGDFAGIYGDASEAKDNCCYCA